MTIVTASSEGRGRVIETIGLSSAFDYYKNNVIIIGE